MGVKLPHIEECRLRVLEHRVLRRDEVSGEWRRLHNKELYALYCSPNIRVNKSRRLRWTRHVARIVESRGSYRVSVGQPEGRPLVRPRRR